MNNTAGPQRCEFVAWEDGEVKPHTKVFDVAPGDTGLAGYICRYSRLRTFQVRLLGKRHDEVELTSKEFKRVSDLWVLFLSIDPDRLRVITKN